MNIPRDIADEELLKLLTTPETQEAAFSFLVDRYSPQLYAAIRRMVYRHEETDDVLQDTFVKVWRHIGTFKGESKLSTWLYSIATNEALSHLRKEKKMRRLPLTTEEYDLTQILMSDPYFDGDLAEAQLFKAIDQLPEKQKLTFELRYFQDLPYKEISEITGTSEGALKANYHHAVKKIKKEMGIEDDTEVD